MSDPIKNGASASRDGSEGTAAGTAEGSPPGGKGAATAMVRTLAGVAVISGLLIVVVFQLTLPTILANRARALKEAVYTVLPGAVSVRNFAQRPDGSVIPLDGEGEGNAKVKGERFYAGFGKDGELTGVAIEAQGQGFQDVIKVLYGYDPERKSIVGMKVLESKETPGLGDKISKDPVFLEQVSDLDVSLDEKGEDLLHPIVVRKGGTRSDRWQIDAITGATISSKAIGRLLGKSAARRLPVLRKNLAEFRKEP